MQENTIQIPREGAIYVNPNVALDLKGQAFLIDGHDTNPDGTPGPGDDLPGISTAFGDPAGDNEVAILSQIHWKQYEQVVGLDDEEPSIGETDEVDIDGLVSQLESSVHETVASGTYSNVTWGDWATDDMEVVIADGDLKLTGTGTGAGILVVKGDPTLSGSFSYAGIIVVLGDIRLVGGGSSTHLWGSLIAQESLEAMDSSAEVFVSGSADIVYSSVVLDWLEAEFSSSAAAGYETVYYDEPTSH